MIQKAEIIDFGEPNILHLKRALESSKQESSAKISIFGDSHIAGDFIPQQWRNAFMEPNAIGFAYPIFPVYHQNLLIHYQHKLFEVYNSRLQAYPDYPMGGIVARAKNEQAYIKLSLNFPKDTQDFFVRVVFKAPSKLGAFLITDAQGRSYRLGAKRIDSWEITEPMKLRFPITIQVLLPNAALGGYFITTEKVAKNNDAFVSHMGANGARSDIWTKWNKELLRQELGLIQYDLIALSYGSNDAMLSPFDEKAYKQRYSELIELLRECNPRASILIIAPPKVLTKPKNAQNYKVTPSFEAVRKATKQVAKANKTLYFDMYDFIEDNGGKDKWISLALSKADVHLTPYGYRLVADAMSAGLVKLLGKIPSKKLDEESTKGKKAKGAKDKGAKGSGAESSEVDSGVDFGDSGAAGAGVAGANVAGVGTAGVGAAGNEADSSTESKNAESQKADSQKIDSSSAKNAESKALDSGTSKDNDTDSKTAEPKDTKAHIESKTPESANPANASQSQNVESTNPPKQAEQPRPAESTNSLKQTGQTGQPHPAESTNTPKPANTPESTNPPKPASTQDTPNATESTNAIKPNANNSTNSPKQPNASDLQNPLEPPLPAPSSAPQEVWQKDWQDLELKEL